MSRPPPARALQALLLVCEHYTNTISSQGLACDPDTGEPIACTGGGPVRKPTAIYTGGWCPAICASALPLCDRPHTWCPPPPPRTGAAGRTAKELSVVLFEGEAAPFKHLRVEHANYLVGVAAAPAGGRAAAGRRPPAPRSER